MLDPKLGQISKRLQLLGKWVHKREKLFCRTPSLICTLLLDHARMASRIRDNLKLKKDIWATQKIIIFTWNSGIFFANRQKRGKTKKLA